MGCADPPADRLATPRAAERATPRWHGSRWHGPPWQGSRWHGPPWHGPDWHRPQRWHRHRWDGGRGGPVGLAVVIALVQTVGTTIAARGEPGGLDLLGYALLAAGGLALAFRRRHPVPTLMAAAATTLAFHALDYPRGPTFVALIIAGVGAVKAGRRLPSWVVANAGYVAWVALTQPTLRQALVLAAWVAGVLLVAEWARAGAAYRARAAQVQRERARAEEEQQRRQVSDERVRIAQELHDVLGHHLSLISVQAGVGLHLMDSQPEQARTALRTIKQASAEALREVRSVLATLRPADEAAPRAPSPGLDRLSELTSDAGLPVTTAVRGAARDLPAEVDRAAYRIVQEALTNVRRHAGSGAAATVEIEYGEWELVVRVDNEGTGGDVDQPVQEGAGISGMRERAVALGGSLTAGPRKAAGQDAAGFRVEARLPIGPAAASRAPGRGPGPAGGGREQAP